MTHDTWRMTHDAWHMKQNVKLHFTHMTHKTWHMTHDTRHMTHDVKYHEMLMLDLWLQAETPGVTHFGAYIRPPDGHFLLFILYSYYFFSPITNNHNSAQFDKITKIQFATIFIFVKKVLQFSHPSSRWVRQGGEQLSPLQKIFQNGSLLLPRLSPEDSGVYNLPAFASLFHACFCYCLWSFLLLDKK